MRPRSALFSLVSLVLLSLACNDDKPAAQTRGPASAEPIPSDLVYNAFIEDKAGASKLVIATDSGVAAASDAGRMTGSTAKLVDAGADPKAPLVYAFAPKARAVTATIKVTTSGAPGQPAQEQPLRFGFTATPKAKAMLGGDATIDIKLTKFDITLPANAPPNAAAQKDQLEKSLIGIAGHFDATTHGDIDNVAFDTEKAPQGAGEIVGVLQQAFEFLVIPLPNEPVGVGAKWVKTESKRLADQGATVATTVNLSLVSRDATTATIKVDATSSGTMAINDPRAPKGTAVQRSTTASYTVVIRFDGVSQKVDGEAKSDITQKVPNQPDQAMTVKIGQTLESK